MQQESHQVVGSLTVPQESVRSPGSVARSMRGRRSVRCDPAPGRLAWRQRRAATASAGGDNREPIRPAYPVPGGLCVDAQPGAAYPTVLQ